MTEARQSRADEMSGRERRYLIMMGIRIVCFVVAVVLVVNHAGWIAIIPALGAIVIPYFAVVQANSARQTGRSPGFREYHPSLPARYEPPTSPTPPGGAHDSPHGGAPDSPPQPAPSGEPPPSAEPPDPAPGPGA